MTGEKLTVEISGRLFDIDPGDLTPIEANAIAQFVSDKMVEIQKQTRVIDTSRLAVLTALNLADELIRLKSKNRELVSECSKRLEVLIKRLEEVLAAESGTVQK